MRITKNVNMMEYQKCGQIMVASKRNKFIMSCNFCRHTFKQLQAFMRHLQLQHQDQLEFVKPAKEVEVYAVEELMNQTSTSCTPDVDSEESNMAEEDSKWLREEDMKWLNEGVEPKDTVIKEETKTANKEKESLDLANMSILKALEDCDVSFNLMEKLNSTTCVDQEEEDGEKETDLDNTLLREIQNEWEDSDSNDSVVKRLYSSKINQNDSKGILEVSNEMPADVTMKESIINSTSVEESSDKPKDNFETFERKNIKNLLQDLEDLDDVDSLLENLEGNLDKQEGEEVKKHENYKIEVKDLKNNKLNTEQITNTKQVLVNTKLIKKTSKISKNKKESLPKNNNLSNKLNEHLKDNQINNFEKRLKEIEQNLEEDIDCHSNVSKKSKKLTKTAKSSSENANFAEKLRDLENLLNEDNDFGANIPQHNGEEAKHVNNEFCTDFELQLKNLEKTLNDEEMQERDCTKPLHDLSPDAEDEVGLNEDLTKALADALGDDDVNMLNIPAEEENDIEEALNQNILNLLDQELMDKEIEQELTAPKEFKQLKVNKEVKQAKLIKTNDKQRKSLEVRSSNSKNVKLKYQKTNFKAKIKLQENLGENVLKSFNSCNVKPIKTKEVQYPLKGNHEVFLQQLSINNSYKSPAKTPTIENMNGKMSNGQKQRKTPNKENQEYKTPVINIRNIKKEKFTPVGSFINTDRGEKTPVKREQIFLKQSPKTQEKQENLNNNITPRKTNKTPQERKFKESPKTLEKREKIETQKTPTTQRQKTPQLKQREILKQSPKTQEKLQQTEQENKTPERQSPRTRQPTCKSPKNDINIRLNEKSTTSPKQQTNTNSLKNPLTTPQRLRNVSIKLQRFTPDKLSNNLTKPQTTKSLENKSQPNGDRSKTLLEHFKLPSGISLTKINPTNSNQQDNNSLIIESPIKSTYCQQNFSESSLEPIEQMNLQKEAPNEVQISLKTVQNQTINHLKMEAINSKIRQRKASIDIVPSPNLENKVESKPQSASKTPRHSNLDYKSYAVNRSARKKEVLQRMRHIKKQIFKSIESGDGITKVNRLKSSPLVKQQKKRKVLIENVQILPNLKKETMTPLINPFDDFKKPFVNHTTSTNNATTGIRPNSVSPKNMLDDQKQAKITLNNSNNDSSINDDEKLIKKSLKRRATSPLLDAYEQVKRQFTSMVEVDEKVVDKTAELETTQLDLSESVVDFLQRDLKANRLNVDSLLNEELPIDDSVPDETSIESNAKETKLEDKSQEKETSNNSNLIDDILEQVVNEEKSNEKQENENNTNKEINLNNKEEIVDFDESKDINLLAKFGLKVLKFPLIEDDVTMEERDDMNEKATKFANIYKNWPRIWSTKNGESATITEELNISFQQLLIETNLAFKLDLTLVELKRLANLINIWYTHNFNSKLVEKRKISDSTNRYLLIFHFIPKTIKRFYYCEYCEEHFNTEHKYFTHRITHTGAPFPYACQKCTLGFRTARHLKNHESTCNSTLKKTKFDVRTPQATYEKAIDDHKCLMCKEVFTSSELLYEHSKTHLKTVYKCVKCELVFASAIDVQNHMAICNTTTKRIPKQCTPRPTKQKN
ncbi:putative leucine-rich repeat-containing protein DDB_G0290503 [Lucilia cuprina]|uniref:putative leucine-rich repeat-containing protein DDB_G0290503 n=1 Tax=Lucilia cuprina TaxID=7375 RepID=UPI001F06DE3B|nr:putative leucine-rich repeat-containing protein DDB_G0290503 [Lucilia cuprina]